jgi:hypothetical protein
LDKFQHNPGPVGPKLPYLDDYHLLFAARRYLKSIGFSENIYGVKVGDIDTKVGKNWLTVADAIEQATKAFLAANPDKAQQIADRIAAKDYFGSGRYDSNELYKKFGNFFRREDLVRWCYKNKGVTRLDDIDTKSPFRLFMQQVATMIGGLTQEDEEKLPTWLHSPRSNWQYGRSDNDKSGSVYKTLLSLLPKPSYDLKTESLEIVKRYPLLVSEKGSYNPRTEASDAMKDASEATVQYLRLVDAVHNKS